MATTEIEKLERRYAENPQGLTFAPLAEIHRKNGDVPRALELLRAGLELHPNYIPASIVLGRCHWDLGDLPAAEAAFSHVLRLDDENVIALKSLADINERLERPGDAQRWLNRLISVDRSNEEARQQLARIEAARQPASTAGLPHEMAAVVEPAPVKAVPPKVEPPAPVAAAPPSATPPKPKPPAPTPATAPMVDLTAAIAEPAPVSPVEPVRTERAEPEPGRPALEFLDTSEPIKTEAEPPANKEPAPLAGLISGEFVPPKDGAYRSHPELTQEFGSAGMDPDALEVETNEEVELHSSGASEFRVPNAAEDFMELAAAASAPVEPLPPIVLEPPSAPSPVLPPLAGLEVIASPPPVSATTPLVSAAPPPVSNAPPLAEPQRTYSARDTKGQSVAAFFRTLLAARLAGSSDTSGSGAGSAGQAAPAPVPESMAPAGLDDKKGTAPAGAGPDASVSFDDFFGAAASGSSQVPKGTPEPGKDDLDQFQSWLQNLKR